MQRQREHPAGGSRVEHADAVRAGGVRDELPRPPRVGVGQSGDEAAQRVVGHGEEHEVGGGDHLVGRHDSTPGSRSSTRRWDGADPAVTATTECPARASAAPSTDPTRPVPMMPTRNRAGGSTSRAIDRLLVRGGQTAASLRGAPRAVIRVRVAMY